jgi:hypothetical protein
MGRCKDCDRLKDERIPNCPTTGKAYIPDADLYRENACLFHRPKLVLAYSLDEQEAAVMAGLQKHRGIDHAVKAPALSLEIGLSDPDGRRVRDLISGLVRKHQAHGEVICSDPGRGYWLAESEEEIQSTRGILASRQAEIGERIDCLDAAAEAWRAKRGA